MQSQSRTQHFRTKTKVSKVLSSLILIYEMIVFSGASPGAGSAAPHRTQTGTDLASLSGEPPGEQEEPRGEKEKGGNASSGESEADESEADESEATVIAQPAPTQTQPKPKASVANGACALPPAERATTRQATKKLPKKVEPFDPSEPKKPSKRKKSQ
jgi:hypothetical protein